MKASPHSPMPATEPDFTHRELWIAITGLSGRIDALLLSVSEREKDVDKVTRDVDTAFKRMRTLEERMVQVRLIGALVVLLMPFITTMIQLRLHIPTSVERQEGKP
jgi:hypothetical protein